MRSAWAQSGHTVSVLPGAVPRGPDVSTRLRSRRSRPARRPHFASRALNSSVRCEDAFGHNPLPRPFPPRDHRVTVSPVGSATVCPPSRGPTRAALRIVPEPGAPRCAMVGAGRREKRPRGGPHKGDAMTKVRLRRPRSEDGYRGLLASVFGLIARRIAFSFIQIYVGRVEVSALLPRRRPQ
jgi:hypothetical protein